MNIENTKKYLSEQRFKTFLDLVNDDFEKALVLYELSSKLNESFYVPLHNLEIVMRNSFYHSIANKYGDDWILDNQRLLAGQSGNKRRLQEKVNDITNNLYGSRLNIHSIISSLNFGFWSYLLNRDYEKDIWRPCLRDVFTKYGKIVLRRTIENKVSKIKDLRNRIFHHENIFKFDVKAYYNLILFLTGLISEEIEEWTIKQDRFSSVYEELMEFANKNNIVIKALKNSGNIL